MNKIYKIDLAIIVGSVIVLMALVGSERIQEIKNPELAQERMKLDRNAYKGYNFNESIGLIIDFMPPGDFLKLPDDLYSFMGGYYGR